MKFGSLVIVLLLLYNTKGNAPISTTISVLEENVLSQPTTDSQISIVIENQTIDSEQITSKNKSAKNVKNDLHNIKEIFDHFRSGIGHTKKDDESDISGTFMSKKYPKPYKSDSSDTFVKSFGQPYGVDIVLEDLDLDGAAGDYLVIKSGKSMEDDGTGVVLTYSISTPRNFRILHSDSVFIDFVVQERSATINNRGFKLTWSRFGEESSSTEISTTTESLPSDKEGRKPDIKVYLEIIAEQFPKRQHDFQDMIVDMATKFCTENNITLRDPATRSNVIINQIVHCSINWPKFDVCTGVNFSVPLFLDESMLTKPHTYELTSDHLNLMWDTYHEEMLKKYNFTAFKRPNDKLAISWWLGISILMTAMFLGLLFAIWKYWELFDIGKENMDKSKILDGMRRESEESNIYAFASTFQVVPRQFDLSKHEEDECNLYEPDWILHMDNRGSMIEDDVLESCPSPPPSYSTNPRHSSENEIEERSSDDIKNRKTRRVVSFMDEVPSDRSDSEI